MTIKHNPMFKEGHLGVVSCQLCHLAKGAAQPIPELFKPPDAGVCACVCFVFTIFYIIFGIWASCRKLVQIAPKVVESPERCSGIVLTISMAGSQALLSEIYRAAPVLLRLHRAASCSSISSLLTLMSH